MPPILIRIVKKAEIIPIASRKRGFLMCVAGTCPGNAGKGRISHRESFFYWPDWRKNVKSDDSTNKFFVLYLSD